MTRGVELLSTILLAADAPAPDPSSGPVVVVVLAIIAAATTLGTGLGPQILEILKSRTGRSKTSPAASATSSAGAPTPAAPTPAATEAAGIATQAVQSAVSGLSMVEQLVVDYRAQRDEAMRRYYDMQRELDEARDIIRNQAVIIARQEVAADNRQNDNYYGRHGSSGYPPPSQNWPPR